MKKWFLILFFLMSCFPVFGGDPIESLKKQLNLTLPKKPYKDLSDLMEALREQKRKKTIQKDLFFGEMTFKKNLPKYLWVFKNQNSRSGVYVIVDSQFNLIYSADTSGTFVSVRSQDLFRVGEKNLLITYHLADQLKDWEITEVLRLKSPQAIDLIYRYSPKSVTQLDYFSSSHLSHWTKGKLRCETQLEWRKKSDQHEPDLSLISRAQVDLDTKGLNSEEMKGLNSLLKKKLGLTLGQSLVVTLDRMSLDGDDPNYFVSYGVKYGDDPIQFGKSPCPGPWLKTSHLPQVIQGGANP
jgi:hypothetical protein